MSETRYLLRGAPRLGVYTRALRQRGPISALNFVNSSFNAGGTPSTITDLVRSRLIWALLVITYCVSLHRVPFMNNGAIEAAATKTAPPTQAL